ncbi:MAG: hypothetical protein AB7P76_08290 [Candidatus Melainabacteria bacterium]
MTIWFKGHKAFSVVGGEFCGHRATFTLRNSEEVAIIGGPEPGGVIGNGGWLASTPSTDKSVNIPGYLKSAGGNVCGLTWFLRLYAVEQIKRGFLSFRVT